MEGFTVLGKTEKKLILKHSTMFSMLKTFYICAKLIVEEISHRRHWKSRGVLRLCNPEKMKINSNISSLIKPKGDYFTFLRCTLCIFTHAPVLGQITIFILIIFKSFVGNGNGNRR